MNQAKIEENQQEQGRKRVKVGGNKFRKKRRWKLVNLQLKFFFHLSTQLSKPNITSLKDIIDFEG